MTNTELIERPATIDKAEVISNREVMPAVPLSLLAAAALAACGGGGASSPAAPQAPSPSPPAAPAPASAPAPTNQEAARFLLQAQFSASTAEIASVSSKGYATWIDEQLTAPASTTGVAWLTSRGYDTIDAATNFYDQEYPGDYMIWHQLMTSSDAVRKRLALALSEFFVVSLGGLNLQWRSYAIAQYWDTLVAGVGGNYRKLLEDITLNPAMGFYLNTKGNLKENAKGRQPDENYAREVMQLFSIGLFQLNIDGTEKTDGVGKKIDSYTQSDVSNLARVFTGYDFDQSQNTITQVITPNSTRNIGNTTPLTRPMVLTAANHSALESVFLGATIAAATPGATALKTALDTLFNHPNVGPFLGRQMIQRLVTSNPSPAYVARVANAFNNNGVGVRGDMKALFRAVLLDDEARNAAGLTKSNFGKLREPMVRMVQWGRSFGIKSAQNSWKISDTSNPASQLGQSPLRSPSVFNFFRPGYIPPSTALARSGQVAPEFQIVTESTVGGYLNYMQQAIRSGIFVPSPEVNYNIYSNPYIADVTASYIEELALVLDATGLVNRLNLILCAGQLSVATQTLIVTALNATPVTAASTDSVKLNRVSAAVLMVMACAEYLIQK